jgi:phosphoribosylanthranilate isomerase
VSFLVKICGVTRPGDAAMVAAAGADAVGINFWPGSRRFIGADANVAEVVAAIPAGVLKFGVFVNAAPSEVIAQAGRWGLDRIQLHGDERPEHFAEVPARSLVRALRVRDAAALEAMFDWNAGLFLLDAFVDGYGGGGAVAPWSLIAAHVARHPTAAPFLLAGGLHAGNVADAIAATAPAGVDVASGVESSPGRKDPHRVADFIAAARQAAAHLPPRR